MDPDISQKLGELIAEVRNGNRRQDEIVVLLRQFDARLQSLELSRATAKGSLGGIKWVIYAAFTIATTLGAERIVQLLTGSRV